MRISDWSSDVCSSVLILVQLVEQPHGAVDVIPLRRRKKLPLNLLLVLLTGLHHPPHREPNRLRLGVEPLELGSLPGRTIEVFGGDDFVELFGGLRSEERRVG